MAETNGPALHSKREKLAAGLYLVATPIGNLGDITDRARAVMAAVDVIACEDTRMTRKLLGHYGLPAAGRLRRHDAHSRERDCRKLIEICLAGGSVALVSDAGAPLISDPGQELVRACAEAGVQVTTLPGASAPIAALQLSGLPSVPFYFAGFLSAKAGERRQQIARLASIPATLLFFEAPHRVAACLADLAQGLGPREAALVREITKRFEEVRRGDLQSLAAELAAAPVKGEIVLVVAPPEPRAVEIDDAELTRLLEEALQRLSLRDAVAQVAAVTDLPRRRVYRLALATTADDAEKA
ncbi:MAG: 16S rRNA (cytidine(1402)-2'-O)-methyltransferase [Rhodospirillales bacterium]